MVVFTDISKLLDQNEKNCEIMINKCSISDIKMYGKYNIIPYFECYIDNKKYNIKYSNFIHHIIFKLFIEPPKIIVDQYINNLIILIRNNGITKNYADVINWIYKKYGIEKDIFIEILKLNYVNGLIHIKDILLQHTDILKKYRIISIKYGIWEPFMKSLKKNQIKTIFSKNYISSYNDYLELKKHFQMDIEYYNNFTRSIYNLETCNDTTLMILKDFINMYGIDTYYLPDYVTKIMYFNNINISEYFDNFGEKKSEYLLKLFNHCSDTSDFLKLLLHIDLKSNSKLIIKKLGTTVECHTEYRKEIYDDIEKYIKKNIPKKYDIICNNNELNILELLIANGFVPNNEILIDIWKYDRSKKFYIDKIDKIIKKYNIVVEKECLKYFIKLTNNIDIIKYFLNYKISIDDEIINLAFQSKNSQVCDILLENYSGEINEEFVVNAIKNNYEIKNINPDIIFDENLYYKCHSVNNILQYYKKKFTIPQNILTLRENFKFNSLKNIKTYMEKNNIKEIDQYCIDNSIMNKYYDVFQFITDNNYKYSKNCVKFVDQITGRYSNEKYQKIIKELSENLSDDCEFMTTKYKINDL